MPKIYYDSQGFPLYNKDDGWKDEDTFQAAALNDMAARQQKKEAILKSMPAQPSSLPAQAADVLPAIGGSLGAMVPGLGETGLSEVGGAAAGSMAKTFLRSKYPEIFGANPDSSGQAADSISDTILGSMPGLSKAMSKVIAGGARISGTQIGRQIASHINDLADGVSGLGKNHPVALQAAKDALRSAGIIIKNQ